MAFALHSSAAETVIHRPTDKTESKVWAANSNETASDPAKGHWSLGKYLCHLPYLIRQIFGDGVEILFCNQSPPLQKNPSAIRVNIVTFSW